MRPVTMARILWKRAQLRSHEKWTRTELMAHQSRSFEELRAFALAYSPFYGNWHRGLERAPLADLPVVPKATMMSHFDEIVTDRSIHLVDLQKHLEGLRDDELFHGRYWVAATSGSSGMRSVIPSDAQEWTTIVASYARANEWSGVRISPLRITRMAIVSSRSTFHQSARVGQTVESPFVRTCRLDAGEPLSSIIEALNTFRPDVLVAYASMIRMFAEEQLAGRLHITLRGVNSASEVLTPEARMRVTQAWGIAPFDVYAATETGGIAAECDRHQGMHLFEDLVISEVVDDDYRPMPRGITGARLLVTVLFSRTLPLIRYELTDRVCLSDQQCSCSRSFQLVAAIEGRTDDIIALRGRDGGNVRIHPVVFHRVLDLLHAEAWQVRQEDNSLRVLIVSPQASVNCAAVAERIRDALRMAGAASIDILVEDVLSISAGAGGKRPLVVAARL
jgi:phenylacetate-CoA ligase